MAVFEGKEDWLLARTKGIGGSDIAAIVGLSPFKRPIDIFIGKTQPVEFSQDVSEAMEWGNLLEPVIRSKYARLAQVEVVSGLDIAAFYPQRSAQWNDQTIVRAEDREWMLGTPDGIIRTNDAGLEIKNCGFKSEDWGEPGTDEIPDHYTIQCQWYMAVTGRPFWDVAVLFGGNRLAVYRLLRNEDLQQELIHVGEEFWNDNVLARTPPPIDGTEGYARYLARKYSLSNGNVITADEAISSWAQELRRAQGVIASAEIEEQTAKNQLADLIGDYEKTEGEFGRINWIRPKQGSRTDWQAVAKALNPPNELIVQHTSPVQNQPYIRAFWRKEK